MKTVIAHWWTVPLQIVGSVGAVFVGFACAALLSWLIDRFEDR